METIAQFKTSFVAYKPWLQVQVALKNDRKPKPMVLYIQYLSEPLSARKKYFG